MAFDCLVVNIIWANIVHRRRAHPRARWPASFAGCCRAEALRSSAHALGGIVQWRRAEMVFSTRHYRAALALFRGHVILSSVNGFVAALQRAA